MFSSAVGRIALLALVMGTLLVSSTAASAQPGGWNSVLAFDVTETSGATLVDYQVQVTVDTATPIAAAQMQSDADDIRFGTTEAGGTELEFWIESGIDTLTTKIWVKIPSLPALQTTRIYMFYGNLGVATTSSPTLFDGPYSANDQLTGGNLGGSGLRQRASRFRTSRDLVVTQIGKNEPTGTTRYITIFDHATEAILYQGQVSGPAATYSYAPLTEPLWLDAGSAYVVTVFLDTGDQYYISGDTGAGPHLTYERTQWCNTCTKDTYPTNETTGHFGYPDFEYYAGPEPVSSLPTVSEACGAAPLPLCAPFLASIGSEIVVGADNVLGGLDFTAGSVVLAYVATASGPLDLGAFSPSAWTPTSLTWSVPSSLALGDGFITLLVVNTDEGYTTSGTRSQLLIGGTGPGLNLPTILSVAGTPLSAADPTVPTAFVETVLAQSATVTIEGTGFNNPLVNLFTSIGNVGPITPEPGATSTSFEIVIPAGAPTGPGSLQVVNDPYSGDVISNAVSVPIGDVLDITSISNATTLITVFGAGFSDVSVINFFAHDAVGAVLNFGGLDAGGLPNIPLTILSETSLRFTIPAGAVDGPAYVMVLNPPFIPYSSTTGDPEGGFELDAP